jgi:3-deoxy-manno-octulosonate cytidylyltransferase (CMP-KDO synthetase)
MRSLVVIPSRLGAVRLPSKPLADIHGVPMIRRVFDNIQRANFTSVWVAYDDDEIGALFNPEDCVKTSDCLTGSDRIAQAIELRNAWNDFDVIINVQGDTPCFDARVLSYLFAPFRYDEVSMVTLVSELDYSQLAIPSSVKAVCSPAPLPGYWCCYDFQRILETPDPKMSYKYHWGIYGFRPSALKAFYSWPQCDTEKERSLEQLRFLHHGHQIWAAEVPSCYPYMCVDTPSDLERVRETLG